MKLFTKTRNYLQNLLVKLHVKQKNSETTAFAVAESSKNEGVLVYTALNSSLKDERAAAMLRHPSARNKGGLV